MSNHKTTKCKQVSKQKLAWNQCQRCHAILQKLNNEEHMLNDCSNIQSTIEQDLPFLFKNFSRLTAVEHSKELIKDVNITKEYLFDYAFMNPSTLKLTNLKIGDLILLKQSDLQITVAICWPSNHIEPSQISLDKNFMNLNGLGDSMKINIFKLIKSSCQIAQEINVDILNSEFCDNEDDESRNDFNLALAFLKEVYLNKYIVDNQQIFIVYMGKKLVFQVGKMAKKGQKLKKKDTDLDFITEKLFCASLTDSKQIIDDKSKPTEKECFTETIDPKPLTENQFNSVKSFNSTLYNQLNLINSSTKFTCTKSPSTFEDINNNQVKLTKEPSTLFNDLAGLNKEIEMIREFFFNPYEFPELYSNIGLNCNKGIILFGPSGCGKTALAKATCNEFKYNFVELKIAEIYSKNYNETETKLKEIFNKAIRSAPSILFIDDIENFCSRKESMSQDSEKKVLTLFTSLIDQLKSKNVSLLCTTSKIDAIDLSLRRPGRLDKEIEISIPNQTARFEILRTKLRHLNHKIRDTELLDVAQNCHGYVGADIELLSQEAGLCCVQRLMTLKRANKPISNDELNSILLSDLYEALHKVKPSAMKEITFDIPKVYWSQIGGQHDLKKKLQQAIIWPIKYAESFKRLNIKAPRGLLMYGPPGCSKTMIAKALATETGLNFIAVKGPELFSKWVGESERMVREIFRKARNAAPSIIFFDEIDAVAMERSSGGNKSNNVGDRVLAQLLNEMDGVENLVDVTIVAATNRPDMIDKALMRPGRLDRIVHVRLPDETTRREIFELKFKQVPVEADINLDILVEKTKRYSGAEIAAICNEAAFLALDTSMQATHISMKHLEMAIDLVAPRTSDSTVQYFDSFSFNSGLKQI